MDSINSERLQDREYLISLISKHCPQYQIADLRMFTLENLRNIVTETLKKQQAQKASLLSSIGMPGMTGMTGMSGMSNMPPLANSISMNNRLSPLSIPNPWLTSHPVHDYKMQNLESVLSSDVLKILEQICACLDKDIVLQEKVKNLRDKLTEMGRSNSFSNTEIQMIKKDYHKDLYDSIVKAYQIRHNDLSQLMAKKLLQPDTEKALCENQQTLYQLLHQYGKMIQ